jgi:hypothetical protein
VSSRGRTRKPERLRGRPLPAAHAKVGRRGIAGLPQPRFGLRGWVRASGRGTRELLRLSPWVGAAALGLAAAGGVLGVSPAARVLLVGGGGGALVARLRRRSAAAELEPSADRAALYRAGAIGLGLAPGLALLGGFWAWLAPAATGVAVGAWGVWRGQALGPWVLRAASGWILAVATALWLGAAVDLFPSPSLARVLAALERWCAAGALAALAVGLSALLERSVERDPSAELPPRA